MPELPEVEAYRRLAEAVLGRPVVEVEAPDAWFLKGGIDASTLRAALLGRSFIAARRIGKLLLLDTSGGGVLGLHFGMTGRLVVDGRPGVERLLYSSPREAPAWNRLTLGLADGGELRVRDPRRLGGVYLDPDESRLGPDVLDLTPSRLRRALAASAAPLKARLLDQGRLAGVGNLLADEALWRAGLSPRRPAGEMTEDELDRLRREIRSATRSAIRKGGVHTGDVMPARKRGGVCPRCATEMERATIGGRTTYWCPAEQV